MKRRVVFVLVAALVFVVVATLWLRRDSSHGKTTPGSDHAAGPGRHAEGAGGSIRSESPSAEAGVPAVLLQAGVPARPVAGTVLFNGSPVEGATVVLSGQASRVAALPPSRTQTDSAGHFDFGERPSMPYEVSASATGHAAALERFDLRDPTLRPPSDQLVLHLGDCSAIITGVIRDASGGVVQGALVGPTRGAAVVSDASGEYELCARVGSYRIDVSADGYGGVSLVVEARGRVRRDVILVPEATFVGTVVRADDDSPVAHALVGVWPAQWGNERPASGRGMTDAQGRFSIAGLNPGRYWAAAHAVGLGSAAQVEVLLEAGRSAERTLKLETRVMVRGRVVESGEPVAGATVSLTSSAPVRYSAPAVSQEDGSFAIEDAFTGESLILADPYEVIRSRPRRSGPGGAFPGRAPRSRPGRR